jgi:hypothetical protein
MENPGMSNKEMNYMEFAEISAANSASPMKLEANSPAQIMFFLRVHLELLSKFHRQTDI